jgi:hypothetical protein
LGVVDTDNLVFYHEHLLEKATLVLDSPLILDSKMTRNDIFTYIIERTTLPTLADILKFSKLLMASSDNRRKILVDDSLIGIVLP